MSGRQIKELYLNARKNGRQKTIGLLWKRSKRWSFSAFAFHDERWTAGSAVVKLQFSRHHRQLRSRYELSLGMHLRDQIGLGVTPSRVPDWTAFLSMLIGYFEVWLLPHWLDLANVEVLAADNTKVPLYMLMVAVHKELDSDDVPDGGFDILLCRDSSREFGE
ncbi:BAF_HP2_G0000010.mRNA.1.CDS.1 [Saccharomyces cerevisiae]|nr:BAF_HP2_G0000010.mRNA.1.CDS.1 [Saccharomyces cerevisiae]CAI6380766.1 BAF_HP2_G0000010.mRNA.1.CDS.1 [Saccharomyces cerevisiae]